MYTVKRDAQGLLIVTDIIRDFHRDTVHVWKYDTERWLKTLTGKEEEVPTQPMDDSEIKWLQKYYLPKLKTC